MTVPSFSVPPKPTIPSKDYGGEVGLFPVAEPDSEVYLVRKISLIGLICVVFYALFISALYLRSHHDPVSPDLEAQIENLFDNLKNGSHCSPGYTMYTPTGKCLKVFRHPQTLHKASLTCLEDQAFLVSIGDVQENEFVVKLYKESNDNLTEEPSAEDSKDDSESIHPKASNFWLGLIHLNNKWLWLDRAAVKFTNWEKGMPENHKEEKCVVVEMKDGKWKNVNCHLKLSVVCEKEPIH